MCKTKLCRECGKIKPLTDFYKHRTRKDGVRPLCKECTLAQTKKYYESHQYKYQQIHARYYQSHLEESKAQRRRYYQEHKEEARVYGRQYQQTHKTEYNAWKRQWRAKNKDKVAAYTRKAKLNPVKNEKARLLRIIRRIFDQQGLSKSPTTERICKCTPMELYRHLCNTWRKNYGHPYTGEPCEIDHIISLKTANTIEEVHKLYHYTNLQLLTKEDNRSKG